MAIDPHSSSSAAAATTTTTTTAAASTDPIQRALPRPTTTTTISPQTQLPRLPPDLFSPTTTVRPRNYIPTTTTSSSARPPPPQGILYPVVSSGRGFISLPKSSDPAVTVANPNPNPVGGAVGYPPRPVTNYVVRPIQHIHHYHHHHPHHNYHYQQPHLVAAAAAATAGPVKGVPVPLPIQAKVAPSPSVPECNGYKDIRDKSRDDSLTVVRDRKVRITEGASLYALCRSWLRNGFPEESQPQYGDVVRSLPKPLPVPMATSNVQKEEEKEEDDDDDEKEDEESVENLSAEDLFKRHVKRAKKVRARLREVRLKRIARYKPRLALLLPPMQEQFRNDAAAGT